MKLKEYARQQGVSYRTAWRWWKAGKLPGHQMDTGTILIAPEAPPGARVQHRVAIYTRVSSAEDTGNLESQAERLAAYCAARGYLGAKVVKEVGSSGNNARHTLLALPEGQGLSHIVGE